jgi:RNA polymerase II subunit A-like phosphatase
VWLAWFTDSIARWERQDETPYLMDEPRSLSATAPDTASSPAPPDAQQISSDPEPDADDWDVEPGSRKGDSEAAAPGVAAAQGNGTADDELDDLKRISEESRNLELSLSWEDVDEELREFLASGDEEDDNDDEDDNDEGDDTASSKGASRRSRNAGEDNRRAGVETGGTGRCAV